MPDAAEGIDAGVVAETVEDARYAPYLERQADEIARRRADEALLLPDALDYTAVPGLSNEMIDRLGTVRPTSLGAASRVRGVTPAALSAVLLHARKMAGMTEDEAIGWTREHVDAGSFERIEAFVAMVVSENEQQNLISPASVDAVWSRHVVDSLQLLPLAKGAAGTWLDIGTGGGFPGMIVAIARPGMTVMVEPRRKRVEFLQSAIDRLGLDQAEVRLAKVERVTVQAGIISARAVASIENLLRAAQHCATTSTRWLLPRGSVDRDELARTAAQHGLMFHVEQSLTQAESSIVVLEAR